MGALLVCGHHQANSRFDVFPSRAVRGLSSGIKTLESQDLSLTLLPHLPCGHTLSSLSFHLILCIKMRKYGQHILSFSSKSNNLCC